MLIKHKVQKYAKISKRMQNSYKPFINSLNQEERVNGHQCYTN